MLLFHMSIVTAWTTLVQRLHFLESTGCCTTMRTRELLLPIRKQFTANEQAKKEPRQILRIDRHIEAPHQQSTPVSLDVRVTKSSWECEESYEDIR